MAYIDEDIFDDIDSMSDQSAEEILAWHRWGDGGPTCPECGCRSAYTITTRNRFKCKACWRQFTSTSGTVLHHRRLTAKQMLKLICLADYTEPSDELIVEIVGVTRHAAPGLARLMGRLSQPTCEFFHWKRKP